MILRDKATQSVITCCETSTI